MSIEVSTEAPKSLTEEQSKMLMDMNESLNGDWKLEVTAEQRNKLENFIVAYMMVVDMTSDEEKRMAMVAELDKQFDSKVIIKE